MKKSILILLVLMVCSALAFAGAAPETQTTAQEKIVKWARDYETTSLDPAEAADDNSHNIVSYMTESLTRYVDGKIVPGIAESWDVSEDGKTIVFHLRESKWSDGTELTAYDFEFAYQRLIDPAVGHSQAASGYIFKNAEAYANGEATLDQVGIKAIDNYTLQLDFQNTSIENLFTLANDTFAPVKKSLSDAVGIAYGSEKDKVLGNGPFAIEEWSHENQIVLVKNENYWNKDAVDIDKLIGFANLTGDTAVEMMLTDSIDIMGTSKPEYLSQLADAGFKSLQYCNTYQFMQINENGHNAEAGRFLSNTNFRLAISYAIDRTALCNTVMKGQTPPNRFIDPSAVGINDYYVNEYPLENGINATADPEKAKEYLNKALAELGATLADVPELSMLCYESGSAMTILQACQDMLLNVLGLKCKIDPQPIQQMIAKVYSSDFDFWYGGLGIGAMDAASPGGVFANWDANDPDDLFGFKNQEYAELLDVAQNAMDMKTRLDAIYEMEKIWCAEVPSILLTWMSSNAVYRSNLELHGTNGAYGADLAWVTME